MPPTDSQPPAVDTRSEFEVALRTLLESAHENGVEVRGGWECRPSSSAGPDWDVVVVELSDREPAGED